MSELSQTMIVVGFGALCFGFGYLTAFIVTRNKWRDDQLFDRPMPPRLPAAVDCRGITALTHGSGLRRRTSSGRKFNSASWGGGRRRFVSLTFQAGPTTSWTATVASLGFVAATQYSVSPPFEAATT